MGFVFEDIGLAGPISLRAAIWGKIKRALHAGFGDSALAYLQGTVSAPFVAGVRRVAVKAIDQRGNGLLVFKKIEDLDK